MAALLSCLLLFSCNSDDMLDEIGANGAGKYRDNICFGISSDESVQTKGNKPADNGYTSDSFVLRSENSDDTLCVNAIVTDGIESSDSVKQHAMTRGAAVTQDDFYDKFHVLAYWKKDGTSTGQFYMNTDVTDKGNNLWSSDRTYIWPGKAHTLTFYAWAPADAGITSPSSPESTTLEYTVPTTVTDQKDVVVATTEEIAGNANTTQPLTFRHICTAVKFKVGDQMQAGTIKKITISGVHNSGAYDMASDSWQLGSNTTVFSIEQDIEMTGNESGSMITDGENTFMMLPQELPAGAKVEIIFHDSQAGTDRTFSASIGGMTWPQGKTVTYTLSITPEYKFEITEENPVIDAHYVIFQTTLKVSGVAPNQSWTITAPIGINNGEDVTIQLQSSMNQFAKRGYWIDRRISANGADRGSERGTNTLSGTGSGEFPIAVYVPENAGESNRTVSLTATVGNVGTAAATIDLTQLCPSWNNGIGCERFEEYDEGFSDGYPWGFLWDENFSITYDMPDLGNIWDAFENVLINFYLTFLDNRDYVDVDRVMLILVRSVTINFGEIPQIDVADDDQNGRQNTLELYNFEGINDASALMAALEQIGATPDIDLPSNPTEFAARAAVMRNKFQAQEDPDGETDPSTGETIIRAVLRDEDCVWYLPSRNEAPNMIDEQYPLSGEYWTSTAIHDNQNAYMYSVGSQPVSERRDISHKVRAVRSK